MVLTVYFLDDRAALLHQILWKGAHSGGFGVVKGGHENRNKRQLKEGLENVSELG